MHAWWLEIKSNTLVYVCMALFQKFNFIKVNWWFWLNKSTQSETVQMFHCDCTCCCVGILFVAALVIYKLLDHFWRRPRIGSFESRYIFITGCDTGYGNLVAKRLDALGCHVFAACQTEQGETDLKKSCSNRLHTVPLDVTKHDSVVKAYEYVKKNTPAGKNQGFCHYYVL